MQWDLIEEHSGAYDKEVCEKIDELTDLFDIILDDMRLYPSMMCVDVFPYRESLSIEIPQYIQNYYEIFEDEEYKAKMKKNFDLRLELEKRECSSIYDALKNIFENDFLITMCASRPVNQSKNIKKVADQLSTDVGTGYVDFFEICKQDLKILQELYIGILFSGWVIRCGNYGILILWGTNE